MTAGAHAWSRWCSARRSGRRFEGDDGSGDGPWRPLASGGQVVLVPVLAASGA